MVHQMQFAITKCNLRFPKDRSLSPPLPTLKLELPQNVQYPENLEVSFMG